MLTIVRFLTVFGFLFPMRAGVFLFGLKCLLVANVKAL